MRVQDGGDEVVRGADRVDVSGEVQVNLFHREDLGSPSAGRASFRAEDRAERRLADRDDALLPETTKRLTESDRREGLALPVSGRGRACHKDELALAGVPDAIHRRQADLRNGVALEDEVVLIESQVRSDIENGAHARGLAVSKSPTISAGNWKRAKRSSPPP